MSIVLPLGDVYRYKVVKSEVIIVWCEAVSESGRLLQSFITRIRKSKLCN